MHSNEWRSVLMRVGESSRGDPSSRRQLQPGLLCSQSRPGNPLFPLPRHRFARAFQSLQETAHAAPRPLVPTATPGQRSISMATPGPWRPGFHSNHGRSRQLLLRSGETEPRIPIRPAGAPGLEPPAAIPILRACDTLHPTILRLVAPRTPDL